MPRVFHPNPAIPSTFDVADGDVEKWKEAGWLTQAPKAARAENKASTPAKTSSKTK